MVCTFLHHLYFHQFCVQFWPTISLFEHFFGRIEKLILKGFVFPRSCDDLCFDFLIFHGLPPGVVVGCYGAELLFDGDEAVVFGDAVCAGEGACLDLA